MDRLFKEFNRSYGVRSYDPVFSDSPVSTPSMLRSVAGATLRAQEELSIPGYRGTDKPLLDGLAINLIDKVLREALSESDYTLSDHFPKRNLFGVRETVEPMTISEIMRSLVDPFAWRDKTQNEEGYFVRDLGLSFPNRDWNRLTFLANISSISSQNAIMGVKLQTKDKDIALGGVESALNRVLKDQMRRNELAKKYWSAPVSPGLPADLRAGLKAALESIGIPNGSYSREGFSSGRFLERQTQAVLKSRTTAATHLKFNRCKCGAVRSVELQPGSRKQGAVLNAFSFNQIVPWHDSFCGLLGGHAERSKAAGLEPIDTYSEQSRVAELKFDYRYKEGYMEAIL